MTDICERLHRCFNDRQRFRFPFDSAAIPHNGIYLLFETRELAHGGDRIVRVGTHSARTLNTTNICPYPVLIPIILLFGKPPESTESRFCFFLSTEFGRGA